MAAFENNQTGVHRSQGNMMMDFPGHKGITTGGGRIGPAVTAAAGAKPHPADHLSGRTVDPDNRGQGTTPQGRALPGYSRNSGAARNRVYGGSDYFSQLMNRFNGRQ